MVFYTLFTQGKSGENMKKFLFILFGLFVVAGAFAAGENVPTSKSYVDSKMTTKQDNITATDAPRAIMNTGVAGEYDTRGIYDSTGEYGDQTRALVDAASMNAGVQSAIDSEFQCIEYDEHGECLLMDLSVARYAGYDIFNGKKDSGLFVNNNNSIVSFDENTKMLTVLRGNGNFTYGNAYFGRGISFSKNYGNFINGHKYYFYAKMRATVPGVLSSIYRDTLSTVVIKNLTTEWNMI